MLSLRIRLKGSTVKVLKGTMHVTAETIETSDPSQSVSSVR
jgi:hypothetical protein